MKIVIAPDSFKDALPAHEVAQAIAEGILSVLPTAEIELCPLADGGEGSLEALQHTLNLQIRNSKCRGPLANHIDAAWGTNLKKQIALIELSKTSGLQLVPSEKRNPLHTNSFGFGELISEAAKEASTVILALGGSSTNDAGVGMASALGYLFLDKKGKPIDLPTGKDLLNIQRIVPPSKSLECTFEVLCDVNNPLFGAQGAAHVFAHQKGASATEIALLDDGLRHISDLISRDLGKEVGNISGAGAAGGLGGGAIAFLDAQLKPGIDTVLKLVEFEQKISKADRIISGEGKLDVQSAMGKVVSGVTAIAVKQGIPVIGLFGQCTLNADAVHALGLEAAFQLQDEIVELRIALENTGNNLRLKSAEFVRNWLETGRFA